MKRRAAFAPGMFLAWCASALALNPSLDVSQYAHASWRYRDGFIKGEIDAFAQPPDGYLWLGTTSGLLRFDGVRAVPWQPPPNQSLPSTNVSQLIAARDGTLWIGTRNGLASWRDGKVTQYAELAGLQIMALLEDHEGSIWVGAYGIPDGKLCEIRSGGVQCHPELGGPGRGVFSLYEGAKGDLWGGGAGGVWRVKPGTPEFYPVPSPPNAAVMAMGEANGELVISALGAIGQIADGKFQPVYPLPPSMRGIRAAHLLRDRDGALWASTRNDGIVHLHQGRTDVFSHSDGLTSDDVLGFFEDREGNIWVATPTGLDRFRDLPVSPFSSGQGFGLPASSVLAAKDGSVWFAGGGALERLIHGQLTVYHGHSTPANSGAREVVVGGLPAPDALFQDSRERIWVSTATGVGYLDGEHYVSTAAPGGYTYAIVEDSAGNMWSINQNVGLIRISPGNEVRTIPWIELGQRVPATYIAADPRLGGIWLGFGEGGIVSYRDGRIRASFSAAQGLAPGHIRQLRFDKDGALWIAADGGLSRLKDGRIGTLTSHNGLPCNAVEWTMDDDAGSTWLNMPCGLVRTPRADVEAWAADAGKTGRAIRTTVFDASDGVMRVAPIGTYMPHVTKAADGKLWFVEDDGFGVIDPLHLAVNKLPPPVHIEQIKVDGKPRDATAGMRLPALIRNVWIDYTALSFAAPEKMHFRYKLEGQDRDWIEVVNDREAQYSNLPPRTYRFRVLASNNDGVWNAAGASFDFSIDPAFYQTRWFQATCVAAFFTLLWGLHRYRLHRIAQRFDVRMEERVGERTRIARELHDTLLQSFQGVLLKLDAVTYLIRSRPDDAEKVLDDVIGQAQAAIVEGREAVHDLRSSATLTNELAKALKGAGDELAREGGATFRLTVEGAARELRPIVRDEIYRISREALRNAFNHAKAQRVEAEITYADRSLRVRIRDDGAGIPPEILKAGRSGHFGLAGMRERAGQIGAKLNIWSRVGAGTEVDLSIPGSIAYFGRKAG